MYSFSRHATLINASVTPKAIGYSMELTGYVNKTYGINMRVGMEMFGQGRIHWTFDFDSLDKLSALNAKLIEDKQYWAMLEKGREYWVDGSLKDVVVMYPR